MILCSNPKAQYTAYKSCIDKAISGVLRSGYYILGSQVGLFEEEFSRYIGVKYAIGVASGTDALHIALRACGINRGDEVITVSHTAVATVSAIECCAARPVLVDIEPDYYAIDPAKIKKAITKRTKAIIPVHIYGQPADMRKILGIAGKYGLKVIEDCAQAHGAMYAGRRVGCFGDMACFSFYPTKNLGGIGDGGIIVTNNPEFAEKAKLLREYGWRQRYISQTPGWNSRLDELQAAILRVKLSSLDKNNVSRRKIAEFYDRHLLGTELILPEKRSGATHVYHLYVVRSHYRDALKDFLKKQGIQALIHYPVPVHLQPAYRRRLKLSGELKETERAAFQVLSLPMYPELTKHECYTIINAIKKFSP